MPTASGKTIVHTGSHWGLYDAEVEHGRVVRVRAFAQDADPSPIIDTIPSAVHAKTRIERPMVRQGWLAHGIASNRAGRGVEPFVAVSWDEAAPYARDDAPDFGLYLDGRWSPPWPHAHVDWPDFGVPADREAATAALADLLARARAGQRVEVGCLGGHGRTGTALALLAVLAGAPPAEAVAWVRAAYCAKAVETAEQAAYVEATAAG